MNVRLGYVALALNLPKVTSSSTVTFRHYSGLTKEQQLNKLKKITASNFADLEKILAYNYAHHIQFYRLTSALIPLATHDEVKNWEYRKFFQDDFRYIGRKIREYGMRVDLHADQFNVINSDSPHVVKNTIRNLLYLAHILNDMEYPEGKIIIHVGSAKGGKKEALQRFVTHLDYFPDTVREKLILENDDKQYTVLDVLDLCTKVGLPMVADVHHHLCLNEGDSFYDSIEDIFHTWEGDPFIPKLHYSSSKVPPIDRRHSDYIQSRDFIAFLDHMRQATRKDFDVMIEAKMKDKALFQLVDDMREKDEPWLHTKEASVIVDDYTDMDEEKK